ncbi:hypothetical protein [Amycolatopsis sp. CA-230715]|uniref:hypothetical protein n=1 Tax=Amycolatopsis sp. CA-230715 TaxID=2745196 RepID=UPI001C0351A6|nr:hypothetical protein [Amycolatopsis sp. CA-230715]QWF77608.1 hypothetical protein HUW46_01000 [Amycolatopsis sp. CA-230715]
MHAKDLELHLTIGIGAGLGPAVEGTAGALLGWLTGRDDGADLTVRPATALPVLPARG